jgi:hypothetical protein
VSSTSKIHCEQHVEDRLAAALHRRRGVHLHAALLLLEEVCVDANVELLEDGRAVAVAVGARVVEVRHEVRGVDHALEVEVGKEH